MGHEGVPGALSGAVCVKSFGVPFSTVCVVCPNSCCIRMTV